MPALTSNKLTDKQYTHTLIPPYTYPYLSPYFKDHPIYEPQVLCRDDEMMIQVMDDDYI